MQERHDPGHTFLKAVAVLFVAAAAFHLTHIMRPAAGDPSGPVRHAVFVAINLAVAAGLWLRPAALRIAFGVLVVQQVASHGTAAWLAWADRHQIDLVSFAIVVLLPLTWAVLWRHGPR